MKKILLLFAILVSTTSLFAQKKNSYALGIDAVLYGRPKQWHGNNDITRRNPIESPLNNLGIWAAWYHKNNYCLRFNFAYLAQEAKYADYSKAPKNFIRDRTGEFFDLTIGKSFF